METNNTNITTDNIDIEKEIDELLPDNTTHKITAFSLRKVLKDMLSYVLDSFKNKNVFTLDGYIFTFSSIGTNYVLVKRPTDYEGTVIDNDEVSEQFMQLKGTYALMLRYESPYTWYKIKKESDFRQELKITDITIHSNTYYKIEFDKNLIIDSTYYVNSYFIYANKDKSKTDSIDIIHKTDQYNSGPVYGKLTINKNIDAIVLKYIIINNDNGISDSSVYLNISNIFPSEGEFKQFKKLDIIQEFVSTEYTPTSISGYKYSKINLLQLGYSDNGTQDLPSKELNNGIFNLYFGFNNSGTIIKGHCPYGVQLTYYKNGWYCYGKYQS